LPANSSSHAFVTITDPADRRFEEPARGVKGALFARYSPSAKLLRRPFLDEFADQIEAFGAVGTAEIASRAPHQLYARVPGDCGDDSVAQLGGAHLACEGASNVLTKLIQ
jgi:hypothetical protein